MGNVEMEKCPIPVSHGRLREFHHVWHQALSDYSDPERFAYGLNALVQSARNVTFLVQSEQASILEFAEWYEGWQQKLKEDSVAAWAAKARTTVVHKDDLVKKSSATARLHDNLDRLRFTMEVPSYIPTEVIAAVLSRKFANSAPELSGCVLAVERVWRIEGLEGIEIMEGFAHLYGLLNLIISEAHDKAGVSMSACSLLLPQEHVVQEGQFTPTCMMVTRGARTVRMTPKDQQAWSAVESKMSYDPEKDRPKVEKHYGKLSPFQLPKDGDPSAVRYNLMEMAQKILRRDRYHQRMFWVRGGDGEWRLHLLEAEDRQQKYLLMQQMAEEVERVGGDAVIEIGEVWTAEMKPNQMPPEGLEDVPDRQEALKVTVAFASGDGVRISGLTSVFYRTKSGVIRCRRAEEDSGFPFNLVPIFDVWKKRRQK